MTLSRKTVVQFISEFSAYPAQWTEMQFATAVRALTDWSSERDTYVLLFGAPESAWTEMQRLQVIEDIALEEKLATKRVSKPLATDGMKRRGRGRPQSATALDSQAVNYQALAAQVKSLIDEAAERGQKIMVTNAVRQVMRASDKVLNGTTANVEPLFQTAYTEVRKILKEKKRGKNTIR